VVVEGTPEGVGPGEGTPEVVGAFSPRSSGAKGGRAAMRVVRVVAAGGSPVAGWVAVIAAEATGGDDAVAGGSGARVVVGSFRGDQKPGMRYHPLSSRLQYPLTQKVPGGGSLQIPVTQV
jgi:hypothetical protein